MSCSYEGWYTKPAFGTEKGPISQAVLKRREALRKSRRKFSGLRFIDTNLEQCVLSAGSRLIAVVLASLDTQPADAFRIMSNEDGEVTIQQIKELPKFRLV